MAFLQNRFAAERRRDKLEALRPPLKEREELVRDAVAHPPLFDSDVMIVSDMGGLVLALGSDDKVVWTYPLEGAFDPNVSSRGMTAATDGRLYVSEDEELTALNIADGSRLGSASVAETDPLKGVAIDGALITSYRYAKEDYHVGRFTPELSWTVPTEDATATLAAGEGCCVYQPDTQIIAALDVSTGKERWRATLDGLVVSTPIIWGGALYLGIRPRTIECLDLSTGKKRWGVKLEINNPSNLVLDPAGLLEVCVHPWHLTFDAKDGKEVRRHDFGPALQDFRISMVLDMDLSRTHLWAAEHFGTIFAVHRQSGRIDWVQTVEGRIPAGHHPVVRKAGIVFLDGRHQLHFYERDK